MPRPFNMRSLPSSRSASPSNSTVSTNSSEAVTEATTESPPEKSEKGEFSYEMGSISNSSRSSFGQEMSQLDSLTAAAASALEGTEKEIKKIPSPAFNQITLPPISKVFPEHFGVRPNPMMATMNSKPNNQNYSNPSPVLSNQQKVYSPLLTSSTNPQIAIKQMQLPNQPTPNLAFRNSPVSFYHSAPSTSLKQHPQHHQQHQHQQHQQLFHQNPHEIRGSIYPVHSHQHHMGTHYTPAIHHQHHQMMMMNNKRQSMPLSSTSSMITDSQQQQPPTKTSRTTIHHPIRNVIEQSNIGGMGSSSSSSSSIQVKLNFRNFGIQLSSKATNLTSNQSGTAAADKEHFAAVMQDCVIATSVDFINAFPDYRPTVNNKLKPLKFIEFLQDQLYFHYKEPTGFINNIPAKDDLVFVYRVPDSLLSKRPGMSRYKIFRHSRTVSVAIYRKGQRIFPVTPEDISDFWSEIPRNKPIKSVEKSIDDLRDDDLVMICRGYVDNLEDEADSLAEDACKVPPGGDLDDILPPQGHVLDDLRGETATILARIGSEFDEYMMEGSKFRIRHVIHVEKSGHTAIDEPWPYAITKHTLVLRPYLAMLYSDASKINRFSPTIEFVLKKAKAAPLFESISKYLGKLSEIQHMAGAIVIGDKLRYWATGGAFIVHLRRESPKSAEWQIFFPGLTSWSVRDLPNIPIDEISVQEGDCLLLCCPELRISWSKDEIISVIKSRALWPEKFQILTNRLKEDRNSKNGIGFYEINSA